MHTLCKELKKFQMLITSTKTVRIGQFCSFLTSTGDVDVKKVHNCSIRTVFVEAMSI